MPKKGAAPAAAPAPDEVATVEVHRSDEDGHVTVTNQTAGKIATAQIPKSAGPAVDLSGTLSDEDDWVSVTYWGPYGTGKTVDLLSMTKIAPKGKVLLINAEGGAKPRSLTQHGIDPDRIVPWPPRGTVLSYEGLEALFFKVASDLQRDPDSWLGGGMDSVTAVEAFLLEQVIDADIAQKIAVLTTTNRGKAPTGPVRDEFLPDTDDYVRMQNQFRSLWRKFRYLPWHWGCTALVRETKVKGRVAAADRVSYGPAVTPKLQNDVGGGPDVVIRTLTEDAASGPVWYGRTYPAGDEAAKDRFGVLPRELVNPTHDRIVAYVRGELTEATDPLQARLPGSAAPKLSSKRPAAPKKTASAPAPGAPDETQAAPATPDTAPVAAARKSGKRTTAAATPSKPATTREVLAGSAKPAPSQLGSDEAPPF